MSLICCGCFALLSILSGLHIAFQAFDNLIVFQQKVGFQNLFVSELILSWSVYKDQETTPLWIERFTKPGVIGSMLLFAQAEKSSCYLEWVFWKLEE